MRSQGIVVVGAVVLALLAVSWLSVTSLDASFDWASASAAPGSSSGRDGTAAQGGALRTPRTSALGDEESEPVTRTALDPQAVAAGDATTRTVRVQVLHAETREPVPGAEVVICQPHDGSIEQRSGESYEDALRRVCPSVQVDAEGLGWIVLREGPAECFAFAAGLYGWEFIGPERSPPPLLIAMAPESFVAGRVVDVTGRPVADVPVHVLADRGVPIVPARFLDSVTERSDAAGRFRIAHLRSRLLHLELDAAGRPRLRWMVDRAGACYGGVVDWERPLVIEVAATGFLDLDVRTADASVVCPPFTAYWIAEDDRRIDFGWPGTPGADLSTEVPVGGEFEVFVEAGWDQRIAVQVMGPREPGERIPVPVGSPWEIAVFRGRVVDSQGEPLPGASISFDFDGRLHGFGSACDEHGRFEEAAWLGAKGGPAVLRRVVVDPEDYRATRLQLDRRVEVGLNDLGDLRVERRELPLVATIRVLGLEPGEVVASCRPVADPDAASDRHPDRLISCRPIGPRVFEARGDWPEVLPVDFEVSGELFQGRGRRGAGETEVAITVQPLGALDVEVLVPREPLENRFFARISFTDGRADQFWFEAVAPDTARGGIECDPGAVTLELLDGERVLATVDDLRIEPRSRLALVGEQAIDLRDAYRGFVVEFVDASGAPAPCSGRWWEWRGGRLQESGERFDGARWPLHLTKDVQRLVFVPDEDFGPAWVEVAGSGAKVPLRAWQEVDLSVDVGELPEGVEAPMEVEIVDDRQPVGWGDPRREALGLDRWERITVCDEPEYYDDYLPGMVLELRVALARVGGRPIEVLRERVEIRSGLESKRLRADPERLRGALESLGR